MLTSRITYYYVIYAKYIYANYFYKSDAQRV